MPILSMSSDINDSNLLYLACTDARIELLNYAEERSLFKIEMQQEMFSISAHPLASDLFICGGDRGPIELNQKANPTKPTKKYANLLKNGNYSAYPPVTSITWHPDGSLFLVANQGFFPCLYSIDQCGPVAVFHADNFDTYSAMKTSSFFGDKGEFVLAGCDDGRVCMWEIPEHILHEQDIGLAKVDSIDRGIFSGTRIFEDNNNPCSFFLISDPKKELKVFSNTPVLSIQIHPELPLFFSSNSLGQLAISFIDYRN